MNNNKNNDPKFVITACARSLSLSLARCAPVSAPRSVVVFPCAHITLCAAYSYAHSHSATNKRELTITTQGKLARRIIGRVTRACLCFARAFAVGIAVAVAVTSLTWESPCSLTRSATQLLLWLLLLFFIIVARYLTWCICICVCACVCTLWLALLCLLILGGFIGRRRHSYLSASADAIVAASHKKIIESKLKPIGIWLDLSGQALYLHLQCTRIYGTPRALRFSQRNRTDTYLSIYISVHK